jgi:hypothetical protein
MKPPNIEGPPEPGPLKCPLGQSLLWFVALWVGGLVSLAAVVCTLRAMIGQDRSVENAYNGISDGYGTSLCGR